MTEPDDKDNVSSDLNATAIISVAGGFINACGEFVRARESATASSPLTGNSSDGVKLTMPPRHLGCDKAARIKARLLILTTTTSTALTNDL